MILPLPWERVAGGRVRGWPPNQPIVIGKWYDLLTDHSEASRRIFTRTGKGADETIRALLLPLRFLPVRLLTGRRLARTATLATLTTRSTRPALTAGPTLTTTLTALSTRARRTEFLSRQLAVAIFVERLQRGGGIRDFLLVNRAIVIGIQRGHDRRHHPLPTLATLAALPALTGAAWATGAALPGLTRRMVAAGALITLFLGQRERG